MLKIIELKTKLISFDLWETLITDRPQGKKINSRSVQRVKKLSLYLNNKGHVISNDQIKKSLNILSEKCTQDHNRGKDIDFHNRIGKLLELLNIKQDDLIKNQIGDILDNCFLKYPPQLFPKSIELLKLLSKEYKLCLTSNTGITSPKTYYKYLEMIGIKNLFDKIYLSNEIKVAKPSIKIFKLILNDFSLNPENIIHIGDNIFTDIFGAKKAGFKAIYVNKRKGVDNDLAFNPDHTVTDISELL
ncbi:MAG: HAD family hydrolase [Chloroflexota bacterium]|nr:HAD family hydrolase [Chloroflexota bacterium]